MEITKEYIRSLFPALSQQVYGKNLVYFDNAATSQRPQSVIELQNGLYSRSNANVHRAMHKLSVDATGFYERGRDAVSRFINADENAGSVIFTSGATASFNLLAACFTQKYIREGDKVLITEAEHHSNIVSWQIALAAKGAHLVVLPVDERGQISLERYCGMLDDRVRLVSVAHISNVLGVVNPVKEMIVAAHAKGIPVALDGAQGIIHANVDVQDLDCDFYIFSGHKIYAPCGTGILYGKKKYLEEMPPYMGGGDMVDTVSFERTTFASLPLKYEAGTPNFAGQACFAPALELASAIREDAGMQDGERELKEYMMEKLLGVAGLHLYGNPVDIAEKAPVFSFTVDGTHPSDMAQILDKTGIAVRSGLMCAEPLVRKFSQVGMLRASLLPYNTKDEVDYFIKNLTRVVSMLK